jgi:ribose transport system permease protein
MTDATRQPAPAASAGPAEAAPAPGGSAGARRIRRITRALTGIAPIFIVLIVLLVAIAILNPRANVTYYLTLLKRAAPLMVLAAGQLFVIVSGEFDLSVGSIITVFVVTAALFTMGDPDATYIAIAMVMVLGLVVGVVNGVVTTRLGVPSFITTLGMLFVLAGGVRLLTAGSPRGDLPPNLRVIGRGGFEAPLIGEVPWAVVVLLIVGLVSFWLMHRTNYGRRLFAVGGNARAAALSGVDVPAVRTFAFVLSAVSAVIAGLLVAGFGGLANSAGEGYEFQAISAVVLGGAVLGGGRGSIPTAMAGALTLEALFTVLNLLRFPPEIRTTVQGLIVIGAVAYASFRLRRAG